MLDFPILLMLIGIPGSGKSSWLSKQEKVLIDGGTYLKIIPDRLKMTHDHNIGVLFHVVCPDEIRKRKTGNISDQNMNTVVWQEAKDETIGCLDHGTNVLLDATNVNTFYRNVFIHDLKCKLWAKLFSVEPQIAYERIKKALDSGIDRATVPEEVVYKMYGEYLYSIKMLESEGFKIL